MKIFLSFILIVLLSACETSKERTAPPMGSACETSKERTAPPMGYVKHCMDYPDSIFCKKDYQ